MQLILDKIKSPVELPRISRPRLLTELRVALNSCTSTIINGRAGTGKTLLAADFAASCGRRIAWYKVDASDSDRRVFFEYLVESVRAQRPKFAGEAIMRLVESSGLEDIPLLAESFIYELLESGGEPLLIVIDDLHLIYDADWVVPFFRRLLPLLPADAHVLITGRSLPPAPLWRMRSKQTLCVIDEGMLAFSKEEAKELFTTYRLTGAQASASHKQTRGRASALDTLAQLLVSTEAEKPPRAKRPKGLRVVQQLHGYVF
ncbi:MAG TPA: AAA family ATPase [Pyrinomonadaceae bacterium]|jgi:LuxR family maltose regulon positive regulatory protein